MATMAQNKKFFLTNGLERLLAERDIKRNPNVQLRKRCQAALDGLKKSDFLETPGCADSYVEVFEIACRSKYIKLQIISLDTLQKLLAYGLVRGNSVVDADTQQRQIDGLIESICGCYLGPHTDDNVSLQIIKALLTAVSSPLCDVHGQSLVTTTRCCYNIYITGKSMIIQATAKATLTQIITTTFQRLEAYYTSKQTTAILEIATEKVEEIRSEIEDKADTDSEVAETADKSDKPESAVDQADEAGGTVKEESHEDSTSEPDTQMENSNTQEGEAHDQGETMKEEDADAKHDVDSVSEGPEKEVEKSATSEESSVPPVDTDTNNTQQSPPTKDGSEKDPSGDASQYPKTAEDKEKESAVHTPSVGPVSGDDELQGLFDHISEVDAYLVFRHFCKLSNKPMPVGVEARAFEVKSKILSLELLLGILQNSGESFRTHPQYIAVVKQQLCASILSNGVSSNPKVFELSLAIFLSLLASFKTHLKNEMDVFFKDIFLPILETSASSFQLKWLVLQALSKVFTDPQTLVDTYLNYDCGLNSNNVFEIMVRDVSKIAQGRQAMELGGGLLETHVQSMKIIGIECLVSCLSSLVEWMDVALLKTVTIPNSPRPPKSDNVSVITIEITQLDIDDTQRRGASPINPPHSPTISSHTPDNADWTADRGDRDEFVEARKRKAEILAILSKFKDKPKKGLLLAQKSGVVGQKPIEVAEWFQSEDRLNKAALGEYLGDPDPFNLEVMYAYVDGLNFTGKHFVDALRLFLDGFRLPGEAQKIDRLMEKFAARYCECNPTTQEDNVFENADTAYVLAYSIIMLTSDLHNTNVKKKMTTEEFIRNNRGINDGRDLPKQYLVEIYNNILQNEITVKVDRDKAKTYYSSAQLMNERTRRGLYREEMQSRLNAAQALLADKAGVHNSELEFVTGTKIAHAKPMFGVAWTPCLGAFSVALQTDMDPYIHTKVLEGMSMAIVISSRFFMDLERDTYVHSLCQFTTLLSNRPQITSRSAECIKTLLNVALTEGNFLKSSWYQVLKCASQLDVVAQLGGNDTQQLLNDPYSPQPSPSLSVHATAATDPVASQQALRKSFEKNHTFINTVKITSQKSSQSGDAVSRTSSQVPTENLQVLSREQSMDSTAPGTEGIGRLVDRVYSGSVQLNGDAIIEFVRHLVAVSLEELAQPPTSDITNKGLDHRMYSLQKIVEIAYYNMNRIRMEWSRIWVVLGDHFNRVGCNPNTQIAIFAIDSLRQLAMKFLERGELSNFHFQKDFLKPFEYIMNHSKRPEIRDMIIQCITQMVASQAMNIHSGWKNIFFVFSLAAGDASPGIVTDSYETVSMLFNRYAPQFHDIAFVDGVNCVVEFACNRHFPGLAMEAMELMRKCAAMIAQDTDNYMAENAPKEGEPAVYISDQIWVQGWFPILFGLHRIMTRCSLDVRTRALTVLIEIVKQNGHTFHKAHWTDLFRIIFRIFDDQKIPEQTVEREEWMSTTCNHALFAIIEMFGTHRTVLLDVAFEDLLDRIHWCLNQGNEQLGRSATQSLQVLLIGNGRYFTTEQWDMTVSAISRMFVASTSNELFETSPEEIHEQTLNNTPPFSFHDVIIKCVVQLELIEAVENVLLQRTIDPEKISHGPVETSQNIEDGLFDLLTTAQHFVIVENLLSSYQFANRFNADTELRTALWKSGFMRQLPNLLKQESSSMHALIAIVFGILTDENASDRWRETETRLIRYATQVLETFAALQSPKQKSIWQPVILLILERLNDLDDERFQRVVTALHPALPNLVGIELSPDVKNAMKVVFSRLGGESKAASSDPELETGDDIRTDVIMNSQSETPSSESKNSIDDPESSAAQPVDNTSISTDRHEEQIDHQTETPVEVILTQDKKSGVTPSEAHPETVITETGQKVESGMEVEGDSDIKTQSETRPPTEVESEGAEGVEEVETVLEGTNELDETTVGSLEAEYDVAPSDGSLNEDTIKQDDTGVQVNEPTENAPGSEAEREVGIHDVDATTGVDGANAHAEVNAGNDKDAGVNHEHVEAGGITEVGEIAESNDTNTESGENAEVDDKDMAASESNNSASGTKATGGGKKKRKNKKKGKN